MSALTLEGVAKRFGSLTAVDGVSLSVLKGTFVCLLGPSGCGKTTLLRLIAGLETPSAGRILLDGQEVTGLPTHQRDFGMVFQSLALFPHLNVRDNVAYPLRIRGVAKAACDSRVGELLDLVRLQDFGGRAVSRLSGGQRQRVAIARALAVSPRLFLLDEPLSALDAKLREAMQVELRQLQQQLGITTIVVTHDQREAMTMADTVVVMRDGRIQQTAVPVDIYRRPANAFVADFIGSTNLLDIAANGSGQALFDGVALPGVTLPAGVPRARLSIRPEDVRLTAPASAPLTGRVTFRRDLGGTVETFVQAADTTIIAVTTPRERAEAAAGEPVGIRLPAEACVILTE